MILSGTDNGKGSRMQITMSSGLMTLQLEDGRKVCLAAIDLCDVIVQAKVRVGTGGYFKSVLYGPSPNPADAGKKKVVEQRLRFFDYKNKDSIRQAMEAIEKDRLELQEEGGRGRHIQMSVWGEFEHEGMRRIGEYPRLSDKETDDGQGSGSAS